jgi:hypothetical protein
MHGPDKANQRCCRRTSEKAVRKRIKKWFLH